MQEVLCGRFTAMRSEAKPATGPVIMEKDKSFCDKMKITDTCTFSDGWQQRFIEPAAEGDIQTEYPSDYFYSPSTGTVKRNTS
jgi:hypothetical protein